MVGIASRGRFLPLYPLTFNGGTPVDVAYAAMFDKEMIYHPSISGYYHTYSRFLPEEQSNLVATPQSALVAVSHEQSKQKIVNKAMSACGAVSPFSQSGSLVNLTAPQTYLGFSNLPLSVTDSYSQTTSAYIDSIFLIAMSVVLLGIAIIRAVVTIRKAGKAGGA